MAREIRKQINETQTNASPGHKTEDIKTVVVIGEDGKDPVAEIIADNQTERKNTVVFTFGRFNPPHVGHLRLFRVVHDTAKALKADYYIIPSIVDYTSRKTLVDMNRYPLTIDERIEFINHLLPATKADDALIDLTNTILKKDGKPVTTPYQIFKKLSELGYKKVIFILGHESGSGSDKPTTTFNVLKKYYRGSTNGGMKVKPYFLHNEKVAGQDKGAILSAQNMSARLIRNILMADPSPENLERFIKAYEGSNIPSAVLEGYYQKWHTRLTKDIPKLYAIPPSRRRPAAPPAPSPSPSFVSALTGLPESFRSALSSFRQSSSSPMPMPMPMPRPVPRPPSPKPMPVRARRAKPPSAPVPAPPPEPRMGTRSIARIRAKA